MKFYVIGFCSAKGGDSYGINNAVVELNKDSICTDMEYARNKVKDMFMDIWDVKMIVVLPFDDSGHVIGGHEAPSNAPPEAPSASESQCKSDQ